MIGQTAKGSRSRHEKLLKHRRLEFIDTLRLPPCYFRRKEIIMRLSFASDGRCITAHANAVARQRGSRGPRPNRSMSKKFRSPFTDHYSSISQAGSVLGAPELFTLRGAGAPAMLAPYTRRRC